MKTKEIIEYAEKYGLQRVAQQIAALTQDCIRLKAAPAEESEIALGASKLGGNPDVPSGFEWPEWQGVNLAFIAQINLAEIPQTTQTNMLPKTGLLSFFYDPDQNTWGFDPKDRGSWRSYYFSLDNLERMTTPSYNSEYMDDPYPGCRVDYELTNYYPDPFDDAIKELQFTESELDRYWEFYEDVYKMSCNHQLLGRPDVIQNPMELECELASNGIYTGDTAWTKRLDLFMHKRRAKNWRLLLQIDTDDDANMMWGDGGMLYYWIKEEDLIQRNFSETWMILQCY